jgi:adenosylcobinamide hydrolase
MDVKVEFHVIDGGDVAVVRFPFKMRTLSSAIVGGGLSTAETAVIMQVPTNYTDDAPERRLEEVCDQLGLGKEVVGFMTAAHVKKVFSIFKEEMGGAEAVVVATAGLSNAVMAGELLPMYTLADSFKVGTINILAMVNIPLEDSGMANAFIPITEAKTAAIQELGARATGTTSDAVMVACPEGSSFKYAGTATNVGIALARATKKAVLECLTKNGDGPRPTDYVMRLEERGVTFEDMWDAAQALYYPNPDWDIAMLKEMFESRINALRDDINVNALILSAIALDERGEAGRLYGLPRAQYLEDPVHLLADEMIAMALAQYISGTKGLFEYTRYDRKKPGILAELPPFLDDIVAALIGGIMSEIYTRLLEGVE